MARKSVLPTTTGGGVLPKVIGSFVVLAVLVIVVKHPSDAATWTKELIGWVGDAVDGIVSFIRQVA